MKLVFLACRHNALQGTGIVDRHLLHGLSVGQQGFLFEVVLVLDSPAPSFWGTESRHFAIFVAGHLHCPLQHLRQDLRHEVGDLLDEWSGVRHHLRHVHRNRGSATMRDFHLSWDVVEGSLVVLVVLYGAYSVSYPQPPWRTRHGCTVGIDRDPPG